jgi:asparagine synthase (glutamine-hydrolysing)
MVSSTGRSVVTYNGEIYNYRVLREELQGGGYLFRTESDTEVLLALYERDGTNGFKRLSGMFAFALWDRTERRLVLVRDRFGIKPLFYTQQDGRVYFGSRIKALRKVASSVGEVDPAAVNAYFLRQYVGGEGTIFSGVKRVLPGQIVEIADSQVTTRYFHEPAPTPPTLRSTPTDRGTLEHALLSAMRRHLVSDVPIGLFLSGGIDSTLLLSLASEVGDEVPDTFTVDFGTDSSSTDAAYARLASDRFGSRHHEIHVGIDECLETLPEIIDHFDQPLADYACLPTLIMSRFARESLKVVLGGEGADEVFGGYRRYRRSLLAETMWPWVAPSARWVPPPLFRDRKRRDLLGDAFIPARDLPSEERIRNDLVAFRSEGAVSSVLRTDMHNWLPDNLLAKVDGMSMMTSLEARVPYLDPEVVDVAFRFGGREKVGFGDLKKLLRDVAGDRVPGEILTRPKSGFTVPVNRWFQGRLAETYRDRVLGGTAAREWLSMEVASNLLEEHGNRGRSGLALWSILVFAWWLEIN